MYTYIRKREEHKNGTIKQPFGKPEQVNHSRKEDKTMKITISKEKDSKRVNFTVNGEEYHTNTDGQGLWTGDDYLKQIDGTAQFVLTQRTTSGMRKAIEKRFRNIYE